MNVNQLTASRQKPYLLKMIKPVTLILLIGLGIIIYGQWEIFVATAIEWQQILHAMLASHISAVSENAFKYGGALIATSFAYGVFHAVGPGHGKAVIITYLGTHKESVWKGVFISFSAALLQSIIAIILVSALARVLKFKLAEVHNYGNDMALVSYVLVMLLGLMLLIGAVRRITRFHRLKSPTNHTENSHHHANDRAHTHDHDSVHSHEHKHETDCGCSHTHVPHENESIWQTLTVIVSMGLRPCSGAIVVLIYAHLVGVYSYGVMATFLMGVGTGLSISLIAISTLYARNWLEKFVSKSNSKNVNTHHSLGNYIRFLGGLVLITLGWSLYSAASTLSAGHPLF